MHASSYMGGKPFAGKKVLVVGSGNTSADVCQDLVTQGASSVTMLQRSPTYVVSSKLYFRDVMRRFKEGVDGDVTDFKAQATPLGLLSLILSSDAAKQDRATFDQEIREGLTRNGFRLNDGIDGSGLVILVYARLGGESYLVLHF